MSELLFESPLTVGIAGGFFSIVAAVIWLQSGNKTAMWTAGVLSGLTVLLLLVSMNVRTDRERIEALLYEIANHVENNRIDAAARYVHPDFQPVVDKVKGELKRYKFTQARVTGIKGIEVNHRPASPTAVAEFNVAVSVTVEGQPFNGVRRFVRLYFIEKDGRWLVKDYEHFEPTAGFRESTPPPRAM